MRARKAQKRHSTLGPKVIQKKKKKGGVPGEARSGGGEVAHVGREKSSLFQRSHRKLQTTFVKQLSILFPKSVLRFLLCVVI